MKQTTKQKKYELESFPIGINVVIILLYITAGILFVTIFIFIIYNTIHYQLEKNSLKERCEAVGGSFESYFNTYQCPAYDSEGYRFYWHFNDDGSSYKTRT